MAQQSLEQLFKHLGSRCRQACEESVALTIKLENNSVTVEHWLRAILDNHETDLVQVLRRHHVNLVEVSSRLDALIEKLQTGNKQPPVLEPDLVTMVRSALIVAVDTHCSVIRTAHIIFVVLNLPLFSDLRDMLADVIPIPAVQLTLASHMAEVLCESNEREDEISGALIKFEHAFISYTRKDYDFAWRLATSIQLSVPIWMDRLSIGIAEDWDSMIDHAIEECNSFIIILSPESVKSIEVRAELRSAIELNKHIVPVLKEKCSIPRYLKVINYVDFTNSWADAIDLLIETIQAKRQKYSDID